MMDITGWINATVIITAFAAGSYYYGKIILSRIPQGYERDMAYTWGFYFVVSFILLPAILFYPLIPYLESIFHPIRYNLILAIILMVIFEYFKLALSAGIGRSGMRLHAQRIKQGFNPNDYSFDPKDTEKFINTMKEQGKNGIKAVELWAISLLYVPGLSYLFTLPQSIDFLTLSWLFLDMVVMIVGLARISAYLGVLFAGFFDIRLRLTNGEILEGRLVKYGDPTTVYKIERNVIKKYTVPKSSIVYGEVIQNSDGSGENK